MWIYDVQVNIRRNDVHATVVMKKIYILKYSVANQVFSFFEILMSCPTMGLDRKNC